MTHHRTLPRGTTSFWLPVALVMIACLFIVMAHPSQAADTCTINRISTNPHHDTDPQVDGNFVVWRSADATGKGRIMLYDITAVTLRIISDPTRDTSAPVIANGTIAWADTTGAVTAYNTVDGSQTTVSDNGGISSAVRLGGGHVWWLSRGATDSHFDVLAYHLPTQTHKTIAQDAVPMDEPVLAVKHTRAVWRGEVDGQGDLFTVDVLTGGDPVNITHSDDLDEGKSVALNGDTLLYTAFDGTQSDVYTADVRSGAPPYNLTDSAAHDETAVMAQRGYLLWSRTALSGGAVSLHLYDLTFGGQPLTVGEQVTSGASLSGGRVVWAAQVDGQVDVFAYDIARSTTIQLTDDSSVQHSAAVNGMNVVWVTDSPVNSEVYHTQCTSAVTDGNTLLADTDFETNGDVWVVKGKSGDKVVCNKTDRPNGKPDKIFAYSGTCAFRFKGSANENSRLQQVTDLPGITLDAGDTLAIAAYVNAKSSVKAKLKVIAIHNDGNKDKIKIALFTTTGYQAVGGATTLTGTVVKIKVIVQNRSKSGKLYVDAINMTSADNASPLPLPLPLVP